MFIYVSTVTPLRTICGSLKPEPIVSVSNEVFISFFSDRRSYINYRGFSLNFTASKNSEFFYSN